MSPQPKPRSVTFEGKMHSFPADATDDEIRQALGGDTPKPAPTTDPLAGIRGTRALTRQEQGLDAQWSDSHPGLIDRGVRAVLGPFVNSATALGRGMKNLVSPTDESRTAALADTFEGGSAMALPFAAPGILSAIRAAPIPFLGSAVTGAASSMAAKAGARMVGAGEDTQRLAGDIGGAGGALAGGVAGARLAPGIRNLTQADPRVALNRGLRPVPSDPGFPERVPQTLATIKAQNGGKTPGGITAGQMDLIPATERAITAHQEALSPWMQRAAGRLISGAPIIQATREATGRMLPSENGAAEGLIDRAQRDYGMDFSPEALRDRLRLLNERMSPFYASSPARQSSALADIPEAVLKSQRDATADTLYRALDPEGGGAGPRLIQSRTGDLIDIKNAALRRNNAIVAEQPLTPLGRMLTPFKALARELMPQRVGTGLAYAEGSEGRSLPFIKRAFNSVDETPNALPQPGTPFYPTGNPGRLLTEGDRITPPPADTSFVRGAGMAPHERVNAERPMLPAGSAPFTQGTVVPDILGRPGQTTHKLVEGPAQPEIPTGQGVHEVPPVDTSGVRSLPAASQVVRDPATGRMKRIYTSQPK